MAADYFEAAPHLQLTLSLHTVSLKSTCYARGIFRDLLEVNPSKNESEWSNRSFSLSAAILAVFSLVQPNGPLPSLTFILSRGLIRNRLVSSPSFSWNEVHPSKIVLLTDTTRATYFRAAKITPCPRFHRKLPRHIWFGHLA